jgi:hypothetical protein
VLLLAVLVRLPAITAVPFDFYSTRQLHGAVIARGIEVRLRAPSDVAVADAERREADKIGYLEPPVLDTVTGSIWAVVGEHLWIPRLLVTLGFLSGAIALWLLADRLMGRLAAWIALGFHAFCSYALAAATSFQPDPLLVGGLCFVFLTGLR